MPGPAHETLVTVIRSHPKWFNALLRALGRAELPAGVKAADTAVRMVNPVEVHPDILFTRGEKKGPWAIVEPQRDDDDGKQRRWLVAAAALLNERGVMGDVIVVTLLTRKFADELLATGRPELAVFAAWAVHHQRGAPAVKVVRRAFEAVGKVGDRALQQTMIRAILNMLDNELREKVHDMVMDLSKVPEGPVHKYLREHFEALGEKHGVARGEAEALLLVLEKREVKVSAAARKRVLACTDKALIEKWIDRAVTATTPAEVFGAEPAAPVKKKPARRTRAR